MSKLIYQTSPIVTLSTNRFINVPTILQFDETPLISIIREQQLGFTTEIPIYHSDGTYLAKVKGTRVYATEDGKKAGIEMIEPKGMTVCKMNGKILFEIEHESGDAFRTQAELYTPSGIFIKSTDTPNPQIINSTGDMLNIGGMQMSGCTIEGCRIGLWLKSDGSVSMGCG